MQSHCSQRDKRSPWTTETEAQRGNSAALWVRDWVILGVDRRCWWVLLPLWSSSLWRKHEWAQLSHSLGNTQIIHFDNFQTMSYNLRRQLEWKAPLARVLTFHTLKQFTRFPCDRGAQTVSSQCQTGATQRLDNPLCVYSLWKCTPPPPPPLVQISFSTENLHPMNQFTQKRAWSKS